jgi:hypothetical protein
MVYGAYWVGSWLLGPRYYFSALPGLCIFTAAGIITVGGWSLEKGKSFLHSHLGWRKVQPLLTAAAVIMLLAANIIFYLPFRLQGLQGLYGIQREDLWPFRTEEVRELAPALFIVHSEQWMPYGSYLELTTPYFDTPFLFAWNLGQKRDAALTAAFQGKRTVYDYYPETPWVFYQRP